MSSTDQIIWRNLSIGSPDAEADNLLSSCFIDNGCLSLVRNVDDHASIVLGRTGQGKSAVLIRLLDVEPNAIEIKPLELAFRFVENSTVIRFFEDAGVNLNLFYRLLWRHVLVTELIKRRYNLNDQNGLSRWLDSFLGKLKPDSAKSNAILYLRRWGENFWQETETRLTEITKKIECELSSSLEAPLLAKMKLGSADKLSDAERREVFSRGSAVVNRIQIADLNRVMQLLSEEAFYDRQNRYYIAIDSLDEDWVSTSAKYRLIRALIEEVRTFRSELKHAKIIVALRYDLIEKVFNETRDGGFQEEKYETYYARIEWTRQDLQELLRRRVNEVFRRKYTSAEIKLEDIFPKSRGDVTPYEYIIERTMSRPRDVIAYANECFLVAANRPRVSWQAITDAELNYSRKRKNALADEWLNTLPSVNVVIDILRGMPETFSRSTLTESAVESIVTQLATFEREDDLVRMCKSALEPRSTVTNAQLLTAMIQVLYHIGAIGVKFSTDSPFIWSFRDQQALSSGEGKRVQSIKVHKMLWRALEIRTGNIYGSDHKASRSPRR
ncbi:hypothetical protein LK996_11080 [Lysobacter sp. A6]|uniref:DNA repair ATPase n=1 Tax=Noviluteimonas lactosilytica TaxID=2888523 RepID=A0ABS8JJ48_9GAMM|nr:hypothetical protein [Lysobacter lactosilyticus]MCC8363611.1 hypothetical protein [Lysobacter lactosilyticus]